MTEEHKNRMKLLNKSIGNIDYPYFNKVLKWQLVQKLKSFLNTVDNREIGSESLKYNDEYPYFTLTIKDLIKKHGGTEGTWNRNINLFATLGLIGKANTFNLCKENLLFGQHILDARIKKARALKTNLRNVKPPNTYYIFPYSEEVFQVAEQRAKAIIDNKISTTSFSKICLQRVFGLEFANSIIFDKNEESEYTLAVYNQIEEIILQKLKEKHYTFKDEVVKAVRIDHEIYTKHETTYRRYKDKVAIALFEYGRTYGIICNKYGIGIAMSTKEMREMFGLENNKLLLYDIQYYNDNVEQVKNRIKEKEILKRALNIGNA